MNAIEVHEAGKRYRQYRDESSLVRRLLQPLRARQKADLWALRDLDFTVARGETLGIVGRNGSGKTTLLRLLSGVSAPTVGRVTVRGSVAPLIGIGVGFNQELTGRENVLVNGRLLGMTRAEVRDRFDDIVEFSEIEDFIDVPVKFYSSGMFLRLAFAVAIHIQPQVMLVDEVLAVGDVAFQAKCFERMREIRREGATIVVVTHNLQVLQRMADRTIVLDHGRAVHDGSTEDAVRIYHDIMQRHRAERTAAVASGAATARFTLVDDEGRPTQQVRSGAPFTFTVTVDPTRPVAELIVGFAVERVGTGTLYAAGGAVTGEYGPGAPLHGSVTIRENPLRAGTYLLRGVVHGDGRIEPLAIPDPVIFHVSSTARGSGAIELAAEITLDGRPAPLLDQSLARIDAAD